MRLKQFTKIFGPRILERAHRRWPGRACAVYALGLRDPLGRMVAGTLHALGFLPNPFERAPPGSREPVVAGGVPAQDLAQVLSGLISADEHFLLDGEPPLVPGLEALRAEFEGAVSEGRMPVLVLITGVHQVLHLQLEESPVEEVAAWGGGIFGATRVIGQA